MMFLLLILFIVRGSRPDEINWLVDVWNGFERVLSVCNRHFHQSYYANIAHTNKVERTLFRIII